jgi:hypothetical protein
MENINHIQEELREIAPTIASITKTNVYSVTPTFFEKLGADIVAKIQSGIEPVYFLSNVTPYTVPNDYFENFPGMILEQVAGRQESRNEVFEEMEKISPLLNTIDKKPVFNVPADYFERAQSRGNPIARGEAKVISIKNASSNFLKYAVAAVIFSIMAVGVFMFLGKEKGTSRAASSSAAVDLKNLSEREIVEFLKKNASYEGLAPRNGYDKANDVKSAVKEMTDKEIQQFLQENAVSEEI